MHVWDLREICERSDCVWIDVKNWLKFVSNVMVDRIFIIFLKI